MVGERILGGIISEVEDRNTRLPKTVNGSDRPLDDRITEIDSPIQIKDTGFYRGSCHTGLLRIPTLHFVYSVPSRMQ
jgi:hypothetical protein